MKLTNMITKLFGYLKLSSLAFVVLLGVYGIILQKGDLSIWRPENRNQFYYQRVTLVQRQSATVQY